MLATRGHRAIPLNSAEDAAEMTQRVQFDAIFCGMRLPGLNWVELFQRVRRKVKAFALLTDGYSPEAERAFREGDGYVLTKPIEDADLDRMLAELELRSSVVK
jgi:CheY-like chemotaxis protein